MIDKEKGIQIKYLEGGIMYIWFYTERSYVPFWINPSDCEKGRIMINFDVAVREANEKSTEYIKVSPEFEYDDYQVMAKQDRDKIVIVCIPRSRIENAVPFKLNKAAEEAAKI